MFKKVFLSWLIAITAEYLLLPGSCRGLEGLEAISQMSEGRTACIFLLSFAVLSFISRRFKTSGQKRLYHRGILFTLKACGFQSMDGHAATARKHGCMMTVTFALLAAASLQASFTPAFFAACCLLFLRLLFDCKHPLPYTALTESRPKLTGRYPAECTADIPGQIHSNPAKGFTGMLRTLFHNLMKGIINIFFREGKIPRGNKKTGRLFLWATVLLSLLFFLFVSVWTVSRVYCFSTPTYDFGIFSQMIHYMKTTGLPYTTLERDGLLSHFHVHISPIYYLLLPFYCLAPVPATLQILQAAVITSAVIPLWKLGRHYGLTPFQQMLLCVLLLLYPAFSGGVGYDIHENCFLTPLLLWLFYGIARRNGLITAAAASLTMLVKEDAPVYVACIGLWLIASSLPQYGSHSNSVFNGGFLPHSIGNCCPEHHDNSKPCHYDKHDPNHKNNNDPHQIDRHTSRPDRWGIITGAIMLSASIAYFFAATGYLAVCGDGVMTARYDNFFYDNGSSLISLVKTVFLCPMKVVYECADAEKLPFISLTILPLLGLPLFTRRWERYLLLIPYVLINLMPDYAYQHDIFFQYVFGSAACLLYLAVINLADLQMKTKQTKTAYAFTTVILTAAAVVCSVCFATTIVPKAVSYPSRYADNREDYQKLCRILSRIPDEAPVTASTFYTTFLSQRDTLYDIHYASREHLLSTEFVVLNPASENDFKQYAGDGKTGYEGLTELLNGNGYQLYIKQGKTVEIYRRKKTIMTYPSGVFTPDFFMLISKTASASMSPPPDSTSRSDIRFAAR